MCVGSIPAILGITFLKKRTSKPQPLKRSKPYRLIAKPKKTHLVSSAVSSNSNLTTIPAPLARVKSYILLTRSRSGTKLVRNPYKTMQAAKTAFFFTFRNRPISLTHTVTFDPVSTPTYFWQTLTPHTQFFLENSVPFTPPFLKSGDLRQFALSYFDSLQSTTPFHRFLTSPYCEQTCLESTYLPNRLPALTFSDPRPDSSLLFYETRSSNLIQRSVSLRLNGFHRALYAQTKYYKMLKRCVARFNVASRYSQNRFLVLFLHHLSHQILSGVSTREQIPDFREIPRTRTYFTPAFTKMCSLPGLVLSKKKKSLTRAYSHFTSSVKASRPTWLSPRDTQTSRTLSRANLTKLVAGVFRQFMIKRLFRPKPIKTYARSIRRIRKCWSSSQFPDFTPRVEKARKKASDRIYEEALFREMLSTPPGEESPLLKTFLYTGFEAMPLMNQKLGNNLFKKNRRRRASVVETRVPNQGKRRHVVRTQLRLTASWAQRADLLRPLIKNLRDHNSALASLNRTSAAERRRRRYTLRYWRKRAAYFSRHSLSTRLVKRRYFRFRKKLKLRKKRFSRNFTIKRELRLQNNDSLIPKKRSRVRHSPKLRPQTKKKKKRKVKGIKLSLRRQTLSLYRFRLLSRQPKSHLNFLTKSTKVRRRGIRKSFRLYRRSKFRSKLGRKKSSLVPHTLPTYYKDFSKPALTSNNLPISVQPLKLQVAGSIPFLPTAKFWASHVLRKYSFFNQMLQGGVHFATWKLYQTQPYAFNFSLALQNQLNAYCFGTQIDEMQKSNLWSFPSSHFTLRKKILRSVSQSSFGSDTGSWAHKCLIQFAERISGRRTAIYIGPFVDQALTLEDHARCILWNTRSSGFKRLLGHRIFTSEALMVLTSSIRLKDPTLLSNWIRGMLKRMSFWKYRVLFRYLKFLIQHLFRFSFPEFRFKGFKLRLKGKISVGGNSRSRVLFYRVGDTSHSKMSNRVAYDLSYINTFTGVLGFKLWFFY